MKGWHHSPETRAKISVARSTPEAIERNRIVHLGKKRPPETGAKISVAFSGRKASPEAVERNRLAHLGQKLTPEQLEHMRASHRTPEARERSRLVHLGKKLTPEHIEKIRLSQLGKKMSPEAIEKTRLAKLGKPHSLETREKLRLANLGKKHTPEHIEKDRVAQNRPETREKKSMAMSRHWNDPEYVEKVQRGWRSKNRLEKYVDVLLQALYPNKFKYNGGYECGITIGGFTPDFVNVNGEKQVIEAFGRRWHPEGDDKIKHGRYAEYGYSCLIIWDYELKDEKATVEKIVAFVGSEPHQYFAQLGG